MAPYPDQSGRPGHALALFSIISIVFALFAFSCGKKSPPTLAAYQKPPAPVLLSAVHREDRIVLSWKFPEARNNLISGFTIVKASDKGLQSIRVSRGKRAFADADFSIGSSYTFRIVARSLTGVLSNDSNALTVTPLTPPPPPSRLSFKIEGNSVILSWEGEGDDILYNVYRRFRNETFGGRPLNALPLSRNSYRDVFHVGKTVHYKIRSLRNRAAEDEGPPSREITVNPSDLVPPAPQDLRYFSAPGKVFLYWKAPKERWIAGYRIYRKTDNRGYTLIGETQVPTFLDTGGPAGQRSYRVNAVGPSMEGPGAEVGGVFFKRHDLE